jgi:hypothetical protein
MKKAMRRTATKRVADEMLAEYDEVGGGVRGKHARSSTAGPRMVILEPDVAEIFPDSKSVNEALRALAAIARRPRRRSGARTG